MTIDSPENHSFANTLAIYESRRVLIVRKDLYSPKAGIEDYLKNPKIKFAVASSGTGFFLDQELEILKKSNRALYVPFGEVALELALLLSRKRVRPNEVESLSEAVQQMRRDGTVKKILAHWISDQDLTDFYQF